jgi:hypothetical protein
MTRDLVGTAAIFLLPAMLIAIGLVGPLLGRRRLLVERCFRALLLILGVGGIAVGLLLRIELAPPALGAKLDDALARPHFGLQTSDIFVAALVCCMGACLVWEAMRLLRGAASLQEARGLLLSATMFGMISLHVHAAPLVALQLGYGAVALGFAALVSVMTWRSRHDGGVSA